MHKYMMILPTMLPLVNMYRDDFRSPGSSKHVSKRLCCVSYRDWLLRVLSVKEFLAL